MGERESCTFAITCFLFSPQADYITTKDKKTVMLIKMCTYSLIKEGTDQLGLREYET